MALTRGRLGGYEFERMVVLFSMVDGEKQIPCAVSTSAMDELEKPTTTKPDQREAQFIRLRDQIEDEQGTETRQRAGPGGAAPGCGVPSDRPPTRTPGARRG